MYTSVEIEFKTEISKEEYEKLINLYDLKDKISSQINYYFDTQKHELINKKIVLRIREKSYNIKTGSFCNGFTCNSKCIGFKEACNV